MPDALLWSTVQSEQRLLMTADKGFADLRTHSPGAHHGIILLRLEVESRSAYLALVRSMLHSADLTELIGTVAVVSEKGIRIRRH